MENCKVNMGVPQGCILISHFIIIYFQTKKFRSWGLYIHIPGTFSSSAEMEWHRHMLRGGKKSCNTVTWEIFTGILCSFRGALAPWNKTAWNKHFKMVLLITEGKVKICRQKAWKYNFSVCFGLKKRWCENIPDYSRFLLDWFRLNRCNHWMNYQHWMQQRIQYNIPSHDVIHEHYDASFMLYVHSFLQNIP
jgi:hypothetical protein